MPAERGKFAIGASVEKDARAPSRAGARPVHDGAGGCRGGRKGAGEAGEIPPAGNGARRDRERESGGDREINIEREGESKREIEREREQARKREREKGRWGDKASAVIESVREREVLREITVRLTPTILRALTPKLAR